MTPAITGFIPTPTAQTRSNSIDYQHAKQLAAIVRKRSPGRRINCMDWADVFRLMRTVDQAHRVRDVLAWYADNYADPYTPAIQSATAFRRRYPDLLAAMNRQRPAVADVTDEAQALAYRLGLLGWPPNALADLPGVVAGLLATYRAHLDSLRRYADQGCGGLHGLAAVVVDESTDPVTFVDGWYTAAHRYYAASADWQGDLVPLSWRPGHPIYLQWARQVAGRYLGQPRAWDKLAEVVGCV